MEKPKIRPVEAFPIEQNGQTLICLRDQTGIARDPIVVGMGAYFLITLFDGANTLADLHAAFTRRFGQFVSPEQLRALIDALDSAHFLDSPAYTARLQEVREEFLRSPQRPAALAGLCYEKDPPKLHKEIESFFTAPGAPGRIPAQRAHLAAYRPAAGRTRVRARVR